MTITTEPGAAQGPNEAQVSQHGHTGHWARCGHCGWVGEECELPPDPDGHECGKDECPECGGEWAITCCYTSEEAAENGDAPE